MPHSEKAEESKGPRKSRLEQLRDLEKNDRFQPDLPPVRAAYMVGYLFEIGPSVAGNPIPYSEIEAWQRCIPIKLTPWECRSIKSLSIEYLNALQKASEANSKSPWQVEENNIDKYLSAMQAKESIRSLIRN